MGTELMIGLLLLTSLSSQQPLTSIPVAHAQEVIQPLAQIPQQDILDVPQKVSPKIPSILEKVALCESGGRQFDKYGNVKRGLVDKRDIGKWQINTYWWGAEAKRLGYDIWTLEGNTAMALHIYKTAGLGPWSASKYCWAV
jgi:hypothetical protein